MKKVQLQYDGYNKIFKLIRSSDLKFEDLKIYTMEVEESLEPVSLYKYFADENQLLESTVVSHS